jgi:heme/copper-type cytochrome/quinol oxidase subunit 2
MVALVALLYSVLGVGMVGSMAPDPPTRQWTIAAYVYLATFIVSFVVLVAAVTILIRRRAGARSNSGSAAV